MPAKSWHWSRRSQICVTAAFCCVLMQVSPAQNNERAKECRFATKAVAAFKERAADEVRARLDADNDLPTARRLLGSHSA